ncbi:gamma-glutamyltransferase family protein [Spirochaeta africana]|uniref:gamma-glutamyltransferase family protein n=1 Tax=Spirochaeta africana TaxID=46355 RepID=UPI00145F0E70|nr:gamma-glutamyltransferase [Spirochaeta africana]
MDSKAGALLRRGIVGILILLAAAGCSTANSLDSGSYTAYFSLPDAHGWNDEVTLEISNGEVVAAYHQRRSAFGETTSAQELDLEDYATEPQASDTLPADSPDTDNLDTDAPDADSIAALYAAALSAAANNGPEQQQLQRSRSFVQESFEPDNDGQIYRFSVTLGSDAEDASLPEFSVIDGQETQHIGIEETFGISPKQLQEILEAAHPDVHPGELYASLEPLGHTRDAERLRALIMRTMALTRVYSPDTAPADTAATADSPPHNQQAGVVSAHFLATAAGIEVLEAGGTATDAAVAVAAALSVVEPWFSSALGGGTWALHYDAASGQVHSQDGVGPVAAGNTVEYFTPRAGSDGLHQAVVPGAWGGWIESLIEFGELPLDQILAPAIRLASDGFPASPELINRLEGDLEAILNDRPDTAAIYLPDGNMPAEGDTLQIPEMADTFQRLADTYRRFAEERGHRGGLAAAADYFYRGPLAERIVGFSDANDGPFALSDFTPYHANMVDPISIDYNGIEVFQNPPNSQGITQLMALNILKDYDFSGYTGPDDPDVVHLLTEAIKLAHIDKYYHVGDPDWVEVPVAELLSAAHADERRAQISMDSVLEWPVENLLPVDPDYSHTTTFQIIDSQGNAVSTTTSLGSQFLVLGDTGIHINNRMRMMSVNEGDPNLIVPGKKVRHTSNPYMALRDDKPYILGGNTGVDTQPQGQTQQFIWVVEFGMSPQDAVSHPRFLTRGFPSAQYPWEADNDLGMEEGTPQELREAMEARGHTVSEGGIWGNANMIVIDPESGELALGADPRGGVNQAEVLTEDNDG